MGYYLVGDRRKIVLQVFIYKRTSSHGSDYYLYSPLEIQSTVLGQDSLSVVGFYWIGVTELPYPVKCSFESQNERGQNRSMLPLRVKMERDQGCKFQVK